MEKKHKDILQKNRTKLIDEIVALESILDNLLTDKIITDSMSQEIMAEKTPICQTRKLLDTLTKRGPRAFHRFCEALMSTHQEHIVDMLDPDFYKNSVCTAKPVVSGATSAGGDSSLHNKKAELPKTSPEYSLIPQPMSVPIGPVTNSLIPQPMSVPIGPVTKKAYNEKEELPTAAISKVQPVQPVPSKVVNETGPAKNKNEEKMKPGPLNLNESKLGIVTKTEDHSLPEPNINPGQPVDELPETAVDWPDAKLDLKPTPNNEVFQVKKLTGSIDDLNKYSLEGRRTCIVIANQHFSEQYKSRNVVDSDRMRIRNVLKQLQFKDITIHTNKSREQLLICLDEERQKVTVATAMLMLIVTSYGANGQIFCVDGGMVTLQEIVDVFSVQNCPQLQGKPKVVLIHAGGYKLEDGSSRPDSHSEIQRSLSQLSLGTPTSQSGGSFTEPDCQVRPASGLDIAGSELRSPSCESGMVLSPSGILNEKLNVNDNSDFLVAIATGPDEDHPHYCSLFLLATLYILCRYSHCDHFLDMLRKVNRLKKDAVKGRLVKICKMKTSLTKKLFLQPCQ